MKRGCVVWSVEREVKEDERTVAVRWRTFVEVVLLTLLGALLLLLLLVGIHCSWSFLLRWRIVLVGVVWLCVGLKVF